MVTKIQKWGNSLGVRIPKALAEDARVKEGMAVDIRQSDRGLLLTPVRSKDFSLDELLKKVTKKNLHTEMDTGAPQGSEAW